MAKTIALKNPTFDYTQLEADDKSKLIYFEGELGKSRKRVADEVVKHGEILHGVQELLANHGDGIFQAWLDSVGISKGSAYNAISAYAAFKDCPNLDKLEVSAVYELAKNEKAKTKALGLADKGIKVTHAMAKALIEKAKPKTRPAVENSGEDLADDTWHERTENNSAAEGERTPPTPEPETDYGKCPNCAGAKWADDDDGEGLYCSKCRHPYGEPAGDVDEGRIKTQRSKTVKTVEALMRAFDDLNSLAANRNHDWAIETCQALLKVAKEWK